MSAKLGLMQVQDDVYLGAKIAAPTWRGLYAVTNVDEPDWHWIEELIEQYSREDKQLELHVRISEKPSR